MAASWLEPDGGRRCPTSFCRHASGRSIARRLVALAEGNDLPKLR